MNPCTLAITVFGMLAVILMTPTSSASIVLSCTNPPPKMRELCNYALEQARSGVGATDNEDFINAYDRGAKRQDVDHVFLRFGRRPQF